MAKAFKCDICGEFYQSYVAIVDKKSNRHTFDGIRSTDLNHSHDMDLCPECMAAVINMLNDRKEICNGSSV